MIIKFNVLFLLLNMLAMTVHATNLPLNREDISRTNNIPENVAPQPKRIIYKKNNIFNNGHLNLDFCKNKDKNYILERIFKRKDLSRWHTEAESIFYSYFDTNDLLSNLELTNLIFSTDINKTNIISYVFNNFFNNPDVPSNYNKILTHHSLLEFKKMWNIPNKQYTKNHIQSMLKETSFNNEIRNLTIFYIICEKFDEFVLPKYLLADSREWFWNTNVLNLFEKYYFMELVIFKPNMDKKVINKYTDFFLDNEMQGLTPFQAFNLCSRLIKISSISNRVRKKLNSLFYKKQNELEREYCYECYECLKDEIDVTIVS
jgi:hypothetical protein